MTRRPFAAACAAAAIAAAPSPAGAASVTCADKPSDPVGYSIRAVHADGVQDPQTTPPIAVLDTGVADVPELHGRLRPGYDAAGGATTNDIDGHGTAVASVAAAAAGGVRGVSQSSPIIPIKIFDDRGESSLQSFIAGVDRAVALGAGVINISAAGPPDADPSSDRAAREAVFRAVTKGIPVIAPSGNEGAAKLDVPAAFPHVIAVGATDPSGAPGEFSNAGTGLDLAAPGATIVTAAPSFLCSSGYGTADGTSFAAPAAAGAAALVLAAHPGLQVGQVADILRLHGRPGSTLWSDTTGFGLLDVAAALAAPVPPADAPEVDDTAAWARKHPFVLTPAKRSVTIAAQVTTQKDPADVFRVKLKKGDRFRASLKGAGAVLSVNNRALTKGRVKKGGTYYVTVTAHSTPPAGSAYTLILKR